MPQNHPQAMSVHHQHHPQHAAHIIMAPSQMAQGRMPTAHFDPSGQVISPTYQMMPAPAQVHTHQAPTGLKRPRPDDLEVPVHSMPGMDHSELASLHTAHMGQSYAQTGSATMTPQPPTHHHHRLPDSEPSAKVMRREEVGGAPSVVGQTGMPEPAPRPKGPKLKFTTEDDQLLIELKEQKNLTWKQIADFFPGRSSGTLQVRYCTKLKAKTKQWNTDMDQKLRSALDDYENEKWRIVSSKLGAGFTPVACRERADELWGDHPLDLEAAETSSPVEPDTSAAEPTGELYSQLWSEQQQHHHQQSPATGQ